MDSWSKKRWWITVGAAIIVLLGTIAWFFLFMYDLSGIRSKNNCDCAPMVLEDEVLQAESIYSGRVTRISRNLNGTYTVDIQPEQTLKGDEPTNAPIRISVDGDCPYPFQKHASYTFILPHPSSERQTVHLCDVIINTADKETMEQINRWLNRNIDDRSHDQDDTYGVYTPSDNGAEAIFEALTSRLSSVRIEEEGFRTWHYDHTESLFFYSPDAKISFFLPIGQSVAQEDFERFTEGISVVRAGDGRRIPFVIGEVSLDVKELPLVIKLYEAPSQDIVIRFPSPNGEETFEVPIQYIEPFVYTVTSPSDPGMGEYIEMLRQGYQAPYYVLNGRTHEYTIQFNHPVDRGSVFEKLNESLRNHPTIAWSLQWLSDYEVRLSMSLDNETVDTVIFSMNGVRTESGYQLVSRERIALQPAEPVVLHAIDLATNTKESYFTSITPFAVIDVSPEGGSLLTGVEGHNGVHTVFQYSIRDRFGNMRQKFGMNEIHYPAWITENELAFVKDNALSVYDVDSGETRTIWQTSGEYQDEKIISFEYAADAGKFAVGSGHMSEDGRFVYELHVFDGPDDAEPLKIEAFGSYECMEGECITPSILFTDRNSIITSRWETAAGEDRYVSVLYMTNLATLESARIDPPARHGVSDHMMFPQKDGTILMVVDMTNDESGRFGDPRPAATERWSIYDPEANSHSMVLDTNLGLFHEQWLRQIIPVSAGQLLLDIYDKGWYLLDLSARKLEKFSGITDRANAIDVEMNRIWFME